MKWSGLPAILILALAGTAQAMNQQQLAAFASEAELRFGIEQNFGDGGVKAKLMLNNASNIALPAGAADWAVYFHSVRKIASDEGQSKGLQFRHIQGDLYSVTPTAQFAGLKAGEQLEVVYSPSSAMVNYNDFMPRAFIRYEKLQPAIFANTDTENIRDFVEPLVRTNQVLRHDEPDLFTLATSASRYEDNLDINRIARSLNDTAAPIIPTPKQVTYQKSQTRIDGQWQIHFAGRVKNEAEYLQQRLTDVLGQSLALQVGVVERKARSIQVSVGKQLGKNKVPKTPESYVLEITADQITIVGSDNAGAFYGIQSLLSLLPAEPAGSVSVPQLLALDSPRAEWRGMHYDMGRNFHGKDVTLRLIEQMSRYKLNKLHLHLTEDEGWRLEIPGLPELTDIGAFRCFDLSEQHCLLTQLGTGPSRDGSGNGFYSVDDFIEILKFSAARHIEVVPEIDMPGHARAAVKAMEARYNRLMKEGKKAEAEQFLLSDPEDKSVYMTVQNYTDNSMNVCMESSYAFVDKVVYELQQMYRKAGLKLNIFHMGGDEVGVGSWEKSPACQQFIAKTDGISGVADLKPWFVSRVSALASKRELALAGWEDGLMYDANNTFNRSQFANDRVLANAWDNIWEWDVADRAYRLANAGYEVILSHATHLYFDHPYEVNPEERGYYWAARFTDAQKVFNYMPDHVYANADKTRSGVDIDNLENYLGRELVPLEKPENILGIQGQVWTETIRTPEQLEEMIYPRLIPLGERAWHKAAWESDKPDADARQREWSRFAAVLAARELPRMVRAGVQIYLPPPGAIRDNGKLLANTAFPGMAIEYSVDQGKTWREWQETSVVEAGEVLLRSRAGNLVSRPTASE